MSVVEAVKSNTGLNRAYAVVCEQPSNAVLQFESEFCFAF